MKNANKIKVFYNKNQTASSNESFSPSAGKPAKVVEKWMKEGHPIEIVDFNPATVEEIALAHDLKYVEGVLNCKIANGFSNKNPDVARSLPWVCGSMIAAAVHAVKTKEDAFSPTSGAHHAHYSHGSGFCTFNSLMIAAIMAHKYGAKKIGIIDLDQHYGDGTDDIIRKLGLDFIEHYSFGRKGVSRGDSAINWLHGLDKELLRLKDCDLILFNAGADPHVNDPLGGVLTTDEFFIRDSIVYKFAKEFSIPVVTSLAGGYQKDANGSIEPVLKIHDQTMRVYRKVFDEFVEQALREIQAELSRPIIRKTYEIKNWARWDHEINEAVDHFHKASGLYPNILIANDPTLGRIDFMANQKRENIKPGPNEPDWRVLSGYATSKYSLDFCLDDSINHESYVLIFDADPDGDGGEPLPVEDNLPTIHKNKKESVA